MKQSVRDTVIRSLSAVGATQEANFYANLFAAQDPERFALIVLDPRCLRNPLLEALTSNLQILANLKLTPILLIGALHEDHANIKFHSQKLYKELDLAGVRAIKLNTRSYALMEEVRKLCRSAKMPILELTDANSGLDLPSICTAINPAKVIFLQPSGGISMKGRRVPVINIDKIETHLKSAGLSLGQKAFLQQVQQLDKLYKSDDIAPPVYVIASPLNLLAELFTTKGSGTLVRRSAVITHTKSIVGIDQDKLGASISEAFGKDLAGAFLESDLNSLYIEANYRGGAIFTQVDGVDYLSKFWVSQAARGEGIARDIWARMLSDHKTFFWRSRMGNPFNDWYMRMCDGMQISGEWRVFWKGLPAVEVAVAIDTAVNAKEDFEII